MVNVVVFVVDVTVTVVVVDEVEKRLKRNLAALSADRSCLDVDGSNAMSPSSSSSMASSEGFEGAIQTMPPSGFDSETDMASMTASRRFLEAQFPDKAVVVV